MNIIVIGSGIAGLYAAYALSENNLNVTLISPEIPERSQSVMAAGGINAAINTNDENDSCELHIEETLKSGKYIEKKEFIDGLCKDAPNIVRELSEMGVMFNRDKNNRLTCRAFGGQSKKRTVFAGASTGKQIVTALVSKIRKAQSEGKINHILNHRFLSALIANGVCYGGIFMNEADNSVKIIYADAVVVATGGQNKLFGKTTGSTLCDGFAEAELFTQGVTLKNLEFIQYHPTTIETSAKRMLISEAARGEGGRLFYYNDDSSRCYFLEEKYGANGNLLSRDIISKEMFDTHKDIFLDVSFLGADIIQKRMPEIYDLCIDYIDLDITKEPIPVSPSVHFFMGGIAVNINHETNIKRLFAIGECASAYHGANRLGGNSLLAATHGAKMCANEILTLSPIRPSEQIKLDFESKRDKISNDLNKRAKAKSKFPVVYIMEEVAKIMRADLGIVRDKHSLESGLKSLDFYLDSAMKISFDGTLTTYESYALPYLIILAKAIMLSALFREESRGAHFRTDFPNEDKAFDGATLVSFDNGEIIPRIDNNEI